jgi:hypothetical protein
MRCGPSWGCEQSIKQGWYSALQALSFDAKPRPVQTAADGFNFERKKRIFGVKMALFLGKNGQNRGFAVTDSLTV